MKRLLLLVTLTGLLCMAVTPAFARVGFINPQRVVNESKIGRTAQEDLARLGRIKDKRINISAERIKSMRAEVDKGMLSVSQQKVREDDIEAALARHKLLIEQSNRSIRDQENQLIQFIMRKADKILRRIAAGGGFTLVLTDPEAIGFIAPEVDLTDRVIEALNNEM
ncbi:OmpH family outer membrane protein [Pseudodesulfovibrio senegalensis]|jgi:outer membrane protein|uniref:OmpH family outer membrane protein n=1 Tax=Pseudodesulfovibrio senegalensis TaxID=1721087 RepID=A0A6N6N6E9_9BACT|nr:OmpH family outer membrane protein [Pseudodesulfovibrio senegalensis]KAB1443473.1 OmpH family outer membrane protein [Pseudodesulfovibrio senegalensis]